MADSLVIGEAPDSDVKVFCCYTPAHEVLLREYFEPSLPDDFELVAHAVPTPGAGDFLSPEFLECIRRKIDLVIASLKDHPGEVILWSDVDIIFLRGSAHELLEELVSSGKDILFQTEGKLTKEVNTGFIVCRCGPSTIRFFEAIRDQLLSQPDKNEQWVANHLLQKGIENLEWGYLPMDYYARTHGWPPPKSIRIYHANYTLGKDGIGQKIRQFRELRLIRNYGLPVTILIGLGKIPRKLKNKFRQ